jgi:hypothetical protein
MARYRAGRCREAPATLEQADLPQQAASANLAFLATTHHRLGQKERAQATLARLREAMKRPEWTENEQSQTFLREAERLIGNQPLVLKE